MIMEKNDLTERPCKIDYADYLQWLPRLSWSPLSWKSQPKSYAREISTEESVG